MKIYFVILLMLMVSCGEDNNSSKQPDCSNIEKVIDLNDFIPATIKSVDSGERFYNGIEQYFEVDAEIYMPSLFSEIGEKYIRIFPVSEVIGSSSGEVEISGSVFKCLTGNHGLASNDLFEFIIIDNLIIK